MKMGMTTEPGGMFSASDFQELLWWIPTGLLVGGIIATIAAFIGGDGIMGIISHFMLGFAAGCLIAALYVPFSEDIGFRWWS